MSNRKFRVLLIIPIALVCIFAIIATAASQIMSSTLDTYLGSGTTSIQKADDTKDWDADYYDADGIDAEEAKDDAYQVAAQVQDEGTVLLKNDGALPLAKGSVVMPFGDAYLNPVYGQNASRRLCQVGEGSGDAGRGTLCLHDRQLCVDAMKGQEILKRSKRHQEPWQQERQDRSSVATAASTSTILQSMTG
jgi:hypothetical protein